MRLGKKGSTNFIDYTKETTRDSQRNYMNYLFWRLQNPQFDDQFEQFNPFGRPFDGALPVKVPLGKKPTKQDEMIMEDLLRRLPKGKIFK